MVAPLWLALVSLSNFSENKGQTLQLTLAARFIGLALSQSATIG